MENQGVQSFATPRENPLADRNEMFCDKIGMPRIAIPWSESFRMQTSSLEFVNDVDE